MFFNLILRNSKSSRKENGLFFSSLIISIIAFYLILSLSKQDVMIFLQKMESVAVNKLLLLIPVFYILTLGILFFLIYFACKYQLQRRKHEFGVYLILGMKKTKLFSMLLIEDIISSFLALLIGLPIALLLSEIISLVTAKTVGMGIIGHQFSLSKSALIFTITGFLIIKLVVFSILSMKICFQEIKSLLEDESNVTKKQKPQFVYILSLIGGISLLVITYIIAIYGTAWKKPWVMFVTEFLGCFGTFLLFYGMRILVQVFSKIKGNRLGMFNFRQLEENVIHQSTTMAVCSLLILAALSCFGAGVGIVMTNTKKNDHILDYTFSSNHNIPSNEMLPTIQTILKEQNLDEQFSTLFPIRIGQIRTTNTNDDTFLMDSVLNAFATLPKSHTRDILLHNLSYTNNPYLLSQSDYNTLLELAGKPTLNLAQNEAGVYISANFINTDQIEIFNQILSTHPEAKLDETQIFLTGDVQTTNLVTDNSITLSFALILPDKQFYNYTHDQYNVYINGILSRDKINQIGLMQTISNINDCLENTNLQSIGINYESYLQNMGRSLFYVVAASYITIYLAIIFMVVSNTILGVQFLMNQRKSKRRYRILIRLGANYPVLCKSIRSQVQWFMGLPIAVASISSIFGVKAIVCGAMSSQIGQSQSTILLVSVAMIFLLLVIEYIYISVVIHSSNRYLLTLMQPQREE